MRFEVASVDSLIIYFGKTIDADTAKDVRRVFFTLKEANLPGITELIPSYTSLLISYDFINFSYEQICKEIQVALEIVSYLDTEMSTRDMLLPVYYGSDVGLDLEELAISKNLSVQDVIDIHSQRTYFVYAIGFAPGFPYMGEVDERIASARLANPRAKVPKGSVGIADTQTAVYPRLSPGGWQIIGRTPVLMFDTSYEGFSYFRVGDKVKFEPISKEEFLKLGGEL
ncbi:5-oxoprolinase subunit PxpB [Sulfurospirillum arcachonense]|uniref:5-oxoprolinase subunit PxpB n=1 Tax=Sulfurospirillum arcachonense TaxID=57666 RepID=UPI00046AC174|nr:5-oxoprolinase subunit PxpB [Sulfurospirillum arcachonense]